MKKKTKELEADHRCWVPKCSKLQSFEIRILKGAEGREIRACAKHFSEAVEKDFLPLLNSWIARGGKKE